MINQYRTLLLNQTDLGNPNEYIAPGFSAIPLPPQLQAFYNLLFPNSTSRYYAQFLAFTYLNYLQAANQEQFIYGLDSRVTYQLANITDYFTIQQISNPVISNYQFPINIYGSYTLNSSSQKNYEDILITQISTNYISIYSKTNHLYYNATSTSPTLTPNFIQQITSNLSSPTSNVFQIYNTGLSFTISGAFIDLVDFNNLTWEFNAQAPFNFNFNTFFNTLLNNTNYINQMLNYNSVVLDQNSYNLWVQHYNPVYRFAGLLNQYILSVNALL